MSILRWKASSRATNPITVMTTELDGLADAAAALSVVISNDAIDELDLYADFELLVTFAATPTENALLELYLVRTVDGTNFEDASSEGRPADGYAGGFVVDNVGTAQRLIARQVQLPPTDFKVQLLNRGGQAFAASGNVLKARFYTEQVTAT